MRVTRDFEAPRTLVWDAHTKPELVRRWMLGPPGWSMPVCEMDLRAGGKYRDQWEARGRTARSWRGRHIYRSVKPRAAGLAAKSSMMTGRAARPSTRPVLTERSGRTTLTLTVLYASKEARDGAPATGMTDGMEQGYARLDEVLAALG